MPQRRTVNAGEQHHANPQRSPRPQAGRQQERRQTATAREHQPANHSLRQARQRTGPHLPRISRRVFKQHDAVAPVCHPFINTQHRNRNQQRQRPPPRERWRPCWRPFSLPMPRQRVSQKQRHHAQPAVFGQPTQPSQHAGPNEICQPVRGQTSLPKHDRPHPKRQHRDVAHHTAATHKEPGCKHQHRRRQQRPRRITLRETKCAQRHRDGRQHRHQMQRHLTPAHHQRGQGQQKPHQWWVALRIGHRHFQAVPIHPEIVKISRRNADVFRRPEEKRVVNMERLIDERNQTRGHKQDDPGGGRDWCGERFIHKHRPHFPARPPLALDRASRLDRVQAIGGSFHAIPPDQGRSRGRALFPRSRLPP